MRIQRKRSFSSITLFLLILFAFSLFNVNVSEAEVPNPSNILLKSGLKFVTHNTNKTQIALALNLQLRKATINSSHLALIKSYSLGGLSDYVFWVTSNKEISLTITTFFSAKKSVAFITIVSPSNTAFQLSFYSSVMIRASAIGVVTQSFDEDNKTLTMIANRTFSSVIRIDATVGEYIYPIYYVVAIYNGTYGYAVPTGAFLILRGSYLNAIATPMNASYLFNYWQIQDSVRVGPNPYAFHILSDMSITPNFKHVSANVLPTQVMNIMPIAIGISVVGFILLLIKGRRRIS